MAGKKPSKVSGASVKQVVLPGKLVKYIGAYKGVFFECPQCKSKINRGFLIELDGVLYCSRACMPKDK